MKWIFVQITICNKSSKRQTALKLNFYLKIAKAIKFRSDW